VVLNLLIDLVTTLFTPLVNALPSVSVSFPSAAGFSTFLAHVDSLIPILSVLTVALTLLGGVVLFFALRFAIVVWHLVYP
jgi:hypothetical protein